jgi:hypothetical protein
MSLFAPLNLSPDTRTLRQFGFIAFVAFGILAALAWREAAVFAFGLGPFRRPISIALLALGATCAMFSLVYPRGNWLAYIGLCTISYPVGLVLSYVTLVLVFALVIGPIAMILRVIGRDPLTRAYDFETSSYWVKRHRRPSKDQYFRQY